MNMPKSAILNISREGMIEKVPLKRLALFFDRLYIDYMALWFAEQDIKTSTRLNETEKNIFLAELDWLKGRGIIHTYKVRKEALNNLGDPDLEEDIRSLN